MTFHREIFPVGQGGFVFEAIGNYSIIFDCGSAHCSARISHFIQKIKRDFTTNIDRLYISHFDNDHVNGIRELIKEVSVNKAVIPYIPPEYRVVYNSVTGGAYQALRELFSDKPDKLQEIPNEKPYSTDIWEWIAKPMLESSDWNRVKTEMNAKCLDTDKLSDPSYVESKKEVINACFKVVFGSAGPNSKGLIMLSQRVSGEIDSNVIIQDTKSFRLEEDTAALYLGDAHVKGDNMSIIQSFLQNHNCTHLLLVQIPHHGSQYNSGWNFDQDIPSSFYFYQDHSSKRLQRNGKFFSSLISSKRLLEVRDVDTDLVIHIVNFQ